MPTPFDAELQRLSEHYDALIEAADADGRFNTGLRKRLNSEASRFMTVARRCSFEQLASCQVDNHWVQHALRTIGRLRYFIDQYQRQQGMQQRDYFGQLYDLKHHLLAALCLVILPEGSTWDAGASTDTATCISLLVRCPGQPIWRMHLHWPCRHVPPPIIAVMQVRYGHWPLTEPL